MNEKEKKDAPQPQPKTFGVFLSGLDKFTKAEDLFCFFEEYRKDITKARVVTNKQGLCSGVGYVDFSDFDQLKSALKAKDGQSLLQRKIKMKVANGTDIPVAEEPIAAPVVDAIASVALQAKTESHSMVPRAVKRTRPTN